MECVATAACGPLVRCVDIKVNFAFLDSLSLSCGFNYQDRTGQDKDGPMDHQDRIG
jgi:hypothetical protein